MNYKEWKKYKLGNLIEINKKTITKNHKFDSIEYYDTSSITENIFSNPEILTNIDAIPSRAKRLISNYDIVYSTVRPIQRHYGIFKKANYNTVVSTGFAVITAKKINPLYLYFYLSQTDIIEFLNTIAESSTTTFPAFNPSLLNELEIEIPSLDTQTKTASILSSLDEKIELNRQTNQTLEVIAQTLFKEMCLPKSEELPEGWRIGKLGDFMETVSKTHKMKQEKIIFLNTSDILEGNILHNNYSDVSSLPGQAKKSIQQNDILLSEIRPANKRFAFVDFDGKDFVVSTKLMVLRSTGELSPYLFYCYLTSNETLNYLQHLAETRSGTFPQITFTQLEDLEITVPPQQILENLTHSVESIYKQILQNNKQTQTLISIRDSLLPKLMKGEIEV